MNAFKRPLCLGGTFNTESHSWAPKVPIEVYKILQKVLNVKELQDSAKNIVIINYMGALLDWDLEGRESYKCLKS